jgi:hypothetical protein
MPLLAISKNRITCTVCRRSTYGAVIIDKQDDIPINEHLFMDERFEIDIPDPKCIMCSPEEDICTVHKIYHCADDRQRRDILNLLF